MPPSTSVASWLIIVGLGVSFGFRLRLTIVVRSADYFLEKGLPW
jgi:hypothetical protein